MKRINKKEQGQVLVLLTMGMITLLGFTALAIDGGRLYSEKRTIQGVADTSSLTGALYIGHYEGAITEAVKQEAIAVAESRAASNGYISDVNVTVDKIPPFYIITTTIWSSIPPTIAQLVYNGPLAVSVKSIARVYRVEEFAFGAAMYSMSSDANKALEISGTGDVKITGTGIYSNSTDSDNAIVFTGSSQSVFTDSVSSAGFINYDSDRVSNLDGTPFTNFDADAEQLGEMYVPTPDCDIPAGSTYNSGGVLHYRPGKYTSGIHINGHGDYVFDKGFYCIYNGFTTKNGTFTGDQVTFYVPTGNVDLAGIVDFRAPWDYTVMDGDNEHWNGMLLYVGTGVLKINGNADSYYEGTIYVPDDDQTPACTLNGNSSSDGFNMQLVCDTIQVNGGGELVIHFDNTVSYIPPVEIDLWE